MMEITNPKTFLYYLDADNILHPNLYKLLDNTDNDKIYTLNQYNRLFGNAISVGCIDTAMVIISLNLCKNIKWKLTCMKQLGILLQNVMIIIDLKIYVIITKLLNILTMFLVRQLYKLPCKGWVKE